MKRSSILMLLLGAIAFLAAASFTDSRVIERDSIVQACDQESCDLAPVVVFATVLPQGLIYDVLPTKSFEVSNIVVVSEKLADALKISIRPPPEYRPHISTT